MKRLVPWCAAVIVLALVVAGVAALLTAAKDDTAERLAVARSAAAATEAIGDFSPDMSARQRDDVERLLGGVLAADYAVRGPEVVFPNAVASRATMTTRVIDAGTATVSDGRARVLMFADQELSTGDGPAVRTPVSRWATMTKTGDRWLLTRLEPVSGQ